MMERELKIRLWSSDDYTALLNALGEPLHERLQVNHYLDTPSRQLLRMRIMARVRAVAGMSLRLTLKWSASRQDGYFVAQEEERDLAAETVEEFLLGDGASVVLPQLCEPLAGVDLRGLHVLGTLRNLRRTYRRQGFILELDRCTYPDGHEDYELELETTRKDDAIGFVENLLGDIGVLGQRQKLTKFERFLAQAGHGPDLGEKK